MRSTDTADIHAPRVFEHDLDSQLFTGPILDDLCREAARRGTLKVQFADPGRQRYGNDPIYGHPRYPLLDDVMRRPLQYRIMGVATWGGDAYAACLERVFELVGIEPMLGRIEVTSVVRVFSPHAIVALHGDPDLKIVCDISGETVWYTRPEREMTLLENENLLRGEFFLRWRESSEQPLHIPPGFGCFVPSRWAHWLDHPCDKPVVSFEVGFWTYESIRNRKVYDVNWVLRRLGVDAKSPGEGNDRLKHRFFDGASTIIRRGKHYRGI